MKIFIIPVLIFFVGLSNSSAQMGRSEPEFISPAESLSTSRTSTLPCYNRTLRPYEGVARTINGEVVRGQDCAPAVALPINPLEPEGEVDSPGMQDKTKTF